MLAELSSRRSLGVLILLLGLIMINGCASRVWNEPLEDGGETEERYGFATRLPDNDDRSFVLVAFSGGGTRSGSLAYGVLEALRDTEIRIDGERGTLLEQVDVITSVSGGAYTASYYGLFGDQIFEDFRERFLYRDWPYTYRWMLANPINLWWMGSGDYSRSDLMADYLNRNLFRGRTFSDMSRGELPLVIVNATDLNNSLTFPFIQPQFDFLCSELSSYPVAYAAMASSAVPPSFAPTALRNYGGCERASKDWVEYALDEGSVLSRRYGIAESLARYTGSEPMPFLRLVDGGVTDNLGVRGSMMSPVAHRGDVASMAGAFSSEELARIEDVLVVMVNAEVYRPYDWSLEGEEPSIFETAAASFGGAFYTLNNETIGQARREFMEWGERVNRNRPDAEEPVNIHFATITFDKVRDPDRRKRFNQLPTADLTRAQVDELRALSARLLRESPEYRSFVESISGR